MFGEKMTTPAVPERVFALCKVVKNSSNGLVSYGDLKEKMEPSYLANESVYFGEYYQAAVELKLVTQVDGIVSLAVDPKVISSPDSMRTYINARLKNYEDGQFFRVTKAFYDMNEGVFAHEKNIAEWKVVFREESGIEINPNELRAWRFWFTYLGFGYLHDMFLVPNASIFLEDAIHNAGLDKRRRYSIGEFIEAIGPYCGTVLNPSEKNFNYGFSSGLRTLHDNGTITMEHILDQSDIWSLRPMELHQISDVVTNVTINQ